MNKLASFFISIFFSNLSYSQNIYVGLHLNQDRDYKTVIPKMIYETNTYDFYGKWVINNNTKILDRSGALLTEERFAENGDKILKLQYSYDTINMLKTSLIFERWTRGYEKMFFFNSYDSNKCLTSIIQKDSLGKVIDHYQYVCNDKGYPFEVYLIDDKGDKILKESAVYFYEQNFASISLIANGTEVTKDTIKINNNSACKFPLAREKYNSYCDLISHIRFDLDEHERLFEKEYVYDSYGNRTEEKSYSNSPDSNGKQIKKVDEVLRKKYVY